MEDSIKNASVDSFSCSDYQIPYPSLCDEIKTQKHLFHNHYIVSTSLNFSIIKSEYKNAKTQQQQQQPQPQPVLIVFMFHGWTSNRKSMIDQARFIIEGEMLSKKRHLCHQMWFVPIDAPFIIPKIQQDSTMVIGDDEDTMSVENKRVGDSNNNSDGQQRAWWDIDGLEFLTQTLLTSTEELFRPQGIGLAYSLSYARAIVLFIKRQCPDAGMCFMGFSQGGGMALNCAAALSDVCNFAGLYICSGLVNNTIQISKLVSLLKAKERQTNTPDVFFKTPIFHSHGTSDPTIFYEIGVAFYNYLNKAVGFQKIQHLTFDGYHEITEQVRKHLVRSFYESYAFCVNQKKINEEKK